MINSSCAGCSISAGDEGAWKPVSEIHDGPKTEDKNLRVPADGSATWAAAPDAVPGTAAWAAAPDAVPGTAAWAAAPDAVPGTAAWAAAPDAVPGTAAWAALEVAQRRERIAELVDSIVGDLVP
jgi:hypothetical protein